MFNSKKVFKVFLIVLVLAIAAYFIKANWCHILVYLTPGMEHTGFAFWSKCGVSITR